jgi:hypothetical protein
MFIDGEDDYNFDSLHNTEFNLNNTTELYTTNQQIHTTTTRPNHIPSYSVQPLPIIQQDEETPPCFLQSGCPLVDMEDLFSFGYALNSTTVGDLFSPPPQDTVNLLSLNTSMTSDLESSCGPAWYDVASFFNTCSKIPKRKKTNKACLSCRKSHLSCEETRPCKRCIKKGIDCVEQPVQPKCTSCPVQINPLTTNHGMALINI